MEVLVRRKQIAEHFKVTTDAVRKWDAKGLISPICTVAGRPLYNLDQVIQAMTQEKGGRLCK